MKTRCPNCQTTFRVTPEQLKARAGNVRCGHCDGVFNALDSLIEDRAPAVSPSPAAPRAAESWPPAVAETPRADDSERPARPPLPESDGLAVSATPAADEATDANHADMTDEPARLSEAEAQELGKATGLILPRATGDIPGYSRWSEGVVSEMAFPPPATPTRWPFVIVALLLTLALAGQLVYAFRSEIVVALPSLRPTVIALSQAVGADVPLPRDVDLVSIEASDLQTDAARGNLLVLNATLRNRAAHEQAYPSLELSLTDTQDLAIARRIFSPADYLPVNSPLDQPFAARSEFALRVWIEARDVPAAGYRLYVFYP